MTGTVIIHLHMYTQLLLEVNGPTFFYVGCRKQKIHCKGDNKLQTGRNHRIQNVLWQSKRYVYLSACFLFLFEDKYQHISVEKEQLIQYNVQCVPFQS